jgi:hypothetical protein
VDRHVEVREPPRDGKPERSRYWLRADDELIGWCNSRKEALEWKRGFGPCSSVSIFDTHLHELVGAGVK